MNLAQLDFKHPECAGLTCLERELFFLLRYRPDTKFFEARRYLCGALSRDVNSLLLVAVVKTWIRFGVIENPGPSSDPPLRLTSRGVAFVEKMEEGGW